MIQQSIITCPHCCHQAVEQMPTDACQFFYLCKGCGQMLKPLQGHCCVFCSYGSVPCPRDVLEPAVEDELAARRARPGANISQTGNATQCTRCLTAVYEIVARWKKQRRAKARSQQALAATKEPGAIRTREPFAVVIFCTSDPCKVDSKTRSKWSRALQHAERLEPDNQSLTQFIKNKGGIDECAGRVV